jgi:hypothetical protein
MRGGKSCLYRGKPLPDRELDWSLRNGGFFRGEDYLGKLCYILFGRADYLTFNRHEQELRSDGNRLRPFYDKLTEDLGEVWWEGVSGGETSYNKVLSFLLMFEYYSSLSGVSLKSMPFRGYE